MRLVAALGALALVLPLLGLRNWIASGDVVVATRVHAYQSGRVDGDEFFARLQFWDTSHRLVQLVKLVSRTKV
jgi:hypothetical protein